MPTSTSSGRPSRARARSAPPTGSSFRRCCRCSATARSRRRRREALVGYGEAIVPLLAYALARQARATLDPAPHPGDARPDRYAGDRWMPSWMRSTIPMASCATRRSWPSRSCDARTRRSRVPRQTLETVVVRETSRYYNGLTLQHNLLRHALDGAESLLGRALEDKLRRSVDRIYRLLGLLYHVEDVAAARYTIEQGERRRRAAAVEYLDNLLGGVVRKRVMPILDDTPLAEKVRYANGVLRSRPRDLEDTLAQLIHDDDPVIAASAIHFAAQRPVRVAHGGLRLRFDASVRRGRVRARGGGLGGTCGQHRRARACRSWRWSIASGRRRCSPRCRSMSSFASPRSARKFVTRPAVRSPGSGNPPTRSSSCSKVRSNRPVTRDRVKELTAPAVVNVEEVLQGIPLRSTIRAIEHSIGFRVPAPVFLTMVSDNILMAQSLFRLLLGQSPHRLRHAAGAAFGTRREPGRQRSDSFRQDPLLAGATAAQLLALRAFALRSAADVREGGLRRRCASRHVPDSRGRSPPGIAGSGPDSGLTAGTTFGVADTLAGTPSGWRAVATGDGRALRARPRRSVRCDGRSR